MPIATKREAKQQSKAEAKTRSIVYEHHAAATGLTHCATRTWHAGDHILTERDRSRHGSRMGPRLVSIHW